jgi:hypothetical protein
MWRLRSEQGEFMKRFAVLTSIVIVLFSSVFLVRAAWQDAAVVPASPGPAITAAETAALAGRAGWNYRHSQPTHWRSCLLQH